MKTFSLVAGLLLLIFIEILHVYFIMPFPGSQKKNTIEIAYWLDRNIFWLRIVLLVLIAYPVISTFKYGRNWKRNFEKEYNNDTLVDRNTHSKWNSAGLCVDGPFKGRQLKPVQSYQEFWHSWKYFHPNTKTDDSYP